jgi:hypothetical protein
LPSGSGGGCPCRKHRSRVRSKCPKPPAARQRGPARLMHNPSEPGSTTSAGRRTGVARTRWSDLLAKLTPPPTSLSEARADPNGAVVFDASETIYLICPAALVGCDERTLHRLSADLDVLIWNSPGSRFIRYERLCAPAIVTPAYECREIQYAGGFWLDPAFALLTIEDAVRGVLAGRLEALPWPTEVLLRRAQAAEPTRARWSRRLAELLYPRMERATSEQRIALAADALAAYETVLALDQNHRRDLGPALTCAFEAGAYGTAARLADLLLGCSWRDIARGRWDGHTGRCICLAHTVSGRIALRAGDRAGALTRLAEAAKAPFTSKAGEIPPHAGLVAELDGLA